MRNIRAFVKRNALEMLRDPILYIFCIGFPVVMLVLFQVINVYTAGQTPMFDASSLIPGMIVFSYSFVMLVAALLVSKDRTTAFLIRLYTSPMKTADFVLGYALPCIVVGVVQEVVCVFSGWIICLIVGGSYFSFAAALLLMLETLPMLFICVFGGILAGGALSDKAAPALTSVFISASGILGGVWMPLDAMGGFETFCRVLPFYPSIYTGRVITGATHTPNAAGEALKYSFDGVAKLGFIPVIVFLVLTVAASIFVFRHDMKNSKR